mmetsp:Transcript_11228/g.24696  ORF Transcript_11228/g.24696 Transcript_11228/m.24696 type:complete len:609 (-) Transcript_11228:113-1939(-)|eukprot:CAMPEP_0172314776 /NCGR_PEP_ID=MMETSP1058-20130122/23330_1 /TAXON_ID=83371 /ORGANISM="Detonula confervacea, Strain CCMP 353" /LENGTH=608 /DNA_ID=CAMNT_0013028723 /DNA_START=109 /DNA_END=1935 /DNA_ORIENTATION=-
MSQVYSTEPATTGRVVFDTTHGPIDVNLWCKECPTATRTFLQLCLDGYYDGMIFHRVLSDFLIQTGLTRNESTVGTTPAADINNYLLQSSAVPSSTSNSNSMSVDPLGLDRKHLELNPRIRFNHRGQVAMALPLEESSSSNGNNEEETAMLRYQFFVTLDEAPFLDAKHVVFGTIAGATMFNALRIGRTDADEQNGVPTDMKDAPPRIKSVKVDYHPYEDLVVTADKEIPWANSAAGGGLGKGTEGKKQSVVEKRRKKRKGKRDLNVLSFGDEERDYEVITSKGSKGESKLSSHDVLPNESTFPSSKIDADVDKRSKAKDRIEKDSGSEMKSDSSGNKQKSLSKIVLSSNIGTVEAKDPPNEVQTKHESNGALGVVTQEPQIERSSSKGDRNRKDDKSNKSRGIGAVEARRAKYLKSGTGSSANKKERLKREGDTMAKLFAFKNKVLETKGSKKDGDSNRKTKKQPADDSLASRMAKRVKQTDDEKELRNREEDAVVAMPGYSGQLNDDESDKDGTADAGDWLGTKFQCKRHMDHDSRKTALDKIGDADDMGGDGRRMDDYVVLDEKRSGRGEKNGHRKHRDNQEHGRHNGSGKHAGRPHKSSGRHPR